jgi:Uncharacterized conserved protein
MSSGLDRFKDYVTKNKIDCEIIILNESTRTSQLAAKALGCTVAEIAKSIVFTCDRPFIIILSGDKRVNLNKLSKIVNCNPKLADANKVYEETGYSIGGVPPFGHKKEIKVYLDKSIERFKHVYAAAGESNAIIKISVENLKKYTNAELVDVSE